MTLDQIFVLKRFLQMTPAEIEQLRLNMKMYDAAVDKLREVVGLQSNVQALASMSNICDELIKIPSNPSNAA